MLPLLTTQIARSRGACRRAAQAACRAFSAKTNNELIHLPAEPRTTFVIEATKSPVVATTTRPGQVAYLHIPLNSVWDWDVLARDAEKGTHPVIMLRETSAQSAGALHLAIPEKWISLDIRTQGQSVSVEKVVEANVKIQTKGGNVSLGTVRTEDVSIDTRGEGQCGSLEGKEVSGTNMELTTGTGPIVLQRLVAQRAHVELEQQPVDIGSVYGEAVAIHTGGGEAQIGNLDVSGCATIKTQGGSVSVNSLDGNAVVLSGGGAADVHVHSKAGSVRLDTAGGNVKLAISPNASIDVSVATHASVKCTDASEEYDEPTQSRLFRFRSGSHEKARYGKLSEGRVVVEPGSGPIEIVREGWLDRLRARKSATA